MRCDAMRCDAMRCDTTGREERVGGYRINHQEAIFSFDGSNQSATPMRDVVGTRKMRQQRDVLHTCISSRACPPGSSSRSGSEERDDVVEAEIEN